MQFELLMLAFSRRRAARSVLALRQGVTSQSFPFG
jgi:hypothetical protein